MRPFYAEKDLWQFGLHTANQGNNQVDSQRFDGKTKERGSENDLSPEKSTDDDDQHICCQQ